MSALRLLEAPRAPLAVPVTDPDDAPEAADPDAWLLCARCFSPIAPASARAQINGQHKHFFSNPHGYLYEIGCFSQAPGCAVDPHETDYFTWFPGYAWALASCAACHQHLGWRYRGAQEFFGLILPRLIPGQRPASA